MKKSIIYTGLALLTISAAALLTTGCNGCSRGYDGPDTIALQPCPQFSADSAMQYIVQQCNYGPRVPGSQAWHDCGDWIAQQFTMLGCEVEEQTTNVTAWDGTVLPCRNIIAHMNPDNMDRILLCAHWDCRPWADNDPNPNNQHTPIVAANDAASGVAVMLELARTIQQEGTLRTGIDFVCFDVEDYGTPQWAENDTTDTSKTWCLGSQYWAEQAAANGYKARFGILFDMVGGRGTSFSKEMVSMQYASPVVEMLWHIANQIGYEEQFPLRNGGYLIDDHVPVNQMARVPCIDIVSYSSNEMESTFGPTWHTVSDTPDNIDPKVLEAVGQSVLQLLYNDNAE